MLAKLYHQLYLIRRVEEEVARIYPTDKVKSPVHLSIGQEAVSVGVCAALEPRDVAVGTYRGHALYLAKGGDLKAMIAELYGKATGCARGKGGSMHLVDRRAGMLGASAVVGTGVPQAVGYALAQKLQGTGAIVACFLGDGAVEEGAFHEALNFAALKAVPVLFIVENNEYAIHIHQARRQTGSILAKAHGYGIPAERIEGGDVEVVRAAAAEAVAAVRAGGGPRLLECMTYRWREHVGPAEDYDAGYRDAAELAPWQQADGVRLAGERLPESERLAVEAAAEAAIAEAFAFAEASPYPDEAALYDDVYA